MRFVVVCVYVVNVVHIPKLRKMKTNCINKGKRNRNKSGKAQTYKIICFYAEWGNCVPLYVHITIAIKGSTSSLFVNILLSTGNNFQPKFYIFIFFLFEFTLFYSTIILSTIYSLYACHIFPVNSFPKS